MSGLAFAQAPPPSVPMRFLATALAWGAVAGGGLAWHGSVLTGAGGVWADSLPSVSRAATVKACREAWYSCRTVTVLVPTRVTSVSPSYTAYRAGRGLAGAVHASRTVVSVRSSTVSADGAAGRPALPARVVRLPQATGTVIRRQPLYR